MTPSKAGFVWVGVSGIGVQRLALRRSYIYLRSSLAAALAALNVSKKSTNSVSATVAETLLKYSSRMEMLRVDVSQQSFYMPKSIRGRGRKGNRNLGSLFRQAPSRAKC
jgi:hypothetical protein